jgi:hypothetical protein
MSYRHYEPNAIGSIVPPFSGGLGGGGSSGPDRFAPKYLVGNVPNGDSAVEILGTGGFWYFADQGDGKRLEAALAQAAILCGDVWIRPGVYDLNQPTSPTVSYIVPAGVTVRGSGGWTAVPSPAITTLIVGRASGDYRVFDCSTFGCAIEGLSISSSIDKNLTGTNRALIEVFDSTVSIRDVVIELNVPELDPSFPSACIAVSGFDASTSVSIDRCLLRQVTGVSEFLGGPGVSCLALFGGRTKLTRSELIGGDYGVYVLGALNSGVTKLVSENTRVLVGARAGVYCVSTYDAEVSLVSDTDVTYAGLAPGVVGVYAPAAANNPPVLSLRCTMRVPGGYGVLANCEQSRITGCRIVADTGIDTSAGDDNIIVANVVDAAPGQQILPSGTDEVAHNILL